MLVACRITTVAELDPPAIAAIRNFGVVLPTVVELQYLRLGRWRISPRHRRRRDATRTEDSACLFRRLDGTLAPGLVHLVLGDENKRTTAAVVEPLLICLPYWQRFVVADQRLQHVMHMPTFMSHIWQVQRSALRVCVRWDHICEKCMFLSNSSGSLFVARFPNVVSEF